MWSVKCVADQDNYFSRWNSCLVSTNVLPFFSSWFAVFVPSSFVSHFRLSLVKEAIAWPSEISNDSSNVHAYIFLEWTSLCNSWQNHPMIQRNSMKMNSSNSRNCIKFWKLRSCCLVSNIHLYINVHLLIVLLPMSNTLCCCKSDYFKTYYFCRPK